MRAVVQRVSRASVSLEDPSSPPVGRIDRGVVALIGVAGEDTTHDARYIAEKIAHLRIFPDAAGKMNRSLLEEGLGALVISQFTLHGDVRRGRRPSFTGAASGEDARLRYEEVCNLLRELEVTVETGLFGGDMKIEMIADGPVTLLLDSRRLF